MDRRGFLKACGVAAIAPLALATAPKRRSGSEHIVTLGPDDVGVIIGPWDDLVYGFHCLILRSEGAQGKVYYVDPERFDNTRWPQYCNLKGTWALLHRSLNPNQHRRAAACVQRFYGTQYAKRLSRDWLLIRFPGNMQVAL